ncbi:MAG TPA: ABC transporter substrate-binding protein [Terriglobales bacterium]|nr:ABC transporter substrate-binding protein [Terriglobales bacterium]
MQPTPTRPLLLLTLTLSALTCATPGRAADNPEAAAVVRGFTDAMLSALKDADKLGFQGRYDLLAPAIEKAFDLDFMAEKSLGSHWAKLSAEQKQQWRAVFTRYMVSNYASRLNKFNNQNFEQLGQEDAGHGTLLVRTRVHDPGNDDVDLNYRVRELAGTWRIVDIYLKGTVSELALRRSDYTAVMKNQGFDALLASVNQKIEAMAAGKVE